MMIVMKLSWIPFGENNNYLKHQNKASLNQSTVLISEKHVHFQSDILIFFFLII